MPEQANRSPTLTDAPGAKCTRFWPKKTSFLRFGAAKNGSHYKLFEAKAVEFGDLLQAAEDWLWSDEASNADAIAKKKEQVLADAKALVPEYFEKVEAERLATEKELEKEAATATAAAASARDAAARESRVR